MSNDFKATHRITFTPTNGPNGPPMDFFTWDVMLDKDDEEMGDGPAYTQEEWDGEHHATWYVTDGRWYCEGQVTPGGANGFVEVERLT